MSAVENTDSNEVRYTVKVDGEWCPEMIDTYAADDDLDLDHAGVLGRPFTHITIGGVEKYRVYTQKKHKWSKFFTEFDKDAPAGDGSPILAIEIYDRDVTIGVHVNGGSWLPGSKGTYDGDTSEQPYAGIMVPMDGIWISR